MTLPTTKPVSRASIAIAALSTIVEWYDFTLYLYFATVISRVFFGEGETSLLLTLAGFAVAYLLRPLGAIFFGHIGDKYGRKNMLCLSMALMMVTMFATALLPTYQHIGAAAGAFILILRGIMAFSVGGEYTGVVAYLLEGAQIKRRGFITSLASAASEVGALLAVGIAAVTVSLIDKVNLDVWGWRIPFFIGGIMAMILLIARSSLQESPSFAGFKSRGKNLTVRDLVIHHRTGILHTFAISALGSITYYIGITYIPVFLTSTGAFSEKVALHFSTIAAFAVIVVTPAFGALSDKVGRKPVLLFLAVTSILLPLILFPLMVDGSYGLTLSSVVLLACIAGGVSAVGAPTTAEQFPIEARLLGLALGATVATAIFGGLTPYLAQLLIEYTESTLIPAIMISLVAICVLPVLFQLPRNNENN